jgi:DNA-binding transcriptional MerR regulator
MITPKQISDSLTVPASTIRRWAARFESYLSTGNLKKGQKRSYTTSDLDTFRRIRDYSASGFSLDRIAELLAVVESPADQSTELLKISDFVQSLEIAHAAVTRLQNQIDDQSNQLEEQQARIQSLEEYINLPWYKKIANKPPKKNDL